MCVPLALACAAGMVVMLFNKGFHIRVGNSDQQIDVKRVVLGFAIQRERSAFPAPLYRYVRVCFCHLQWSVGLKTSCAHRRRRDFIDP